MHSLPTPRSRPLRFLDCCAHVLVLLATAVIALSLRLVATLLVPFRRRVRVARILNAMFRGGLRSLWGFFEYTRLLRLTVEGTPAAAPAVLVANHPSFIDALLLIPKLPRTACLYKSSLERGFFPRPLAENAGFISNKGEIESIRESVIRLREGWRMLVFPEGTRTATPPMNPWKSAYALMAARAGAPVQPIYLEISSPVFPKGAPWWSPPRFPVRVRIRFGTPLPPPDEASVRLFHRKVESSFRDELLCHTTFPDSPVSISS